MVKREVTKRRDRAIMLKHMAKTHGKPYAFAYMDQWKLAMEEWDQERANEEIACGDGDRES